MPWTASSRPKKKYMLVAVGCTLTTSYWLLFVLLSILAVYCSVVCVVCVCYHPVYSGRQVCGRTSRGHTGGRLHRIFHPPSFCGACLHFYREKDSVSCSFPSSTVESNLRFINRSPLVGHFLFFVRKNPSSCDDTEIRTHVSTSGGFEVTN